MTVKLALLDSGYDPSKLDRLDKNIHYKDFISGKSKPSDECLHGTVCLATITENIDPGQVELFVGKIFDKQGRCENINIISDALIWAMEKDVDIINMSFGSASPLNTRIERLLKAANAAEIAIVKSSGNTATMTWPARLPFIISIGSVDSQKKNREGYSGYLPDGVWAVTDGNAKVKVADKEIQMRGTSFACARFAGLLAKHLSKLRKEDENVRLNPNLIAAWLKSNALDINKEGYDLETGFGYLQCQQSQPGFSVNFFL